jgi:Phasin protein
MMNTDENTPIKGTGKNGKGQPPAKKAAKRSRKPAQQAAPEPVQPAAPEPVQPEQMEQPQEPIIVVAAAMENPPADVVPDVSAPTAAPDALAPTAPDALAPTAPDTLAPTAPTERAETVPVTLQTITNAYGDFARKSIEQASSFFEQLAGVRSLNRAFELQGEFVKQTFETFVAESRKIRELHSELMMQRLRNLEGFVARMKPTRST